MKTSEQKRREAEERKAEHAKRSAVDQLALLDSRRGGSLRERERLANLVKKDES